jgi:hypothetical protein
MQSRAEPFRQQVLPPVHPVCTHRTGGRLLTSTHCISQGACDRELLPELAIWSAALPTTPEVFDMTRS